MRALLFIIGLLLVAAGIIIGVTSFLSPGEVILGLNLGLAATLLIGGFIVIALSAVVGAIDNLAGSMMSMNSNQMVRESLRADPAASSDSAAIAAAGAATATAGLVAATAANATETVAETAGDAIKVAGSVLEPEAGTIPAIDAISASAAEIGEVPAAETIVGEVRKSVGIDDVQLDSTGDGSPVLSERISAAAEEIVPEGPDTASVASRFEEITAGVRASAEAGGDKFEEFSEAASDSLTDVTAAVEDKVDAVTEVISDAPESIAETAQDAVETVVDSTEAVSDAAADLAEDVTEEIPDVTSVAEALPEADGVEELAAKVEEEAEAVADAVASDEAEPEVVEVVEVEEEAAPAEPEVTEAKAAVEPEVTDTEEVEAEAALESEKADEPGDGADEQQAADVKDEGALYVVEETTVRERPARMLSDGTVEAETDAGWMRFENMDHLNEYLDAMTS